MTTALKVDPQKIDSIASIIATATTTIDSELSRLETTAATLPWSGTAQAAYEVAQARWATVLVELNSILKEAKSIAEQSGTMFRQVEKEAVALWS